MMQRRETDAPPADVYSIYNTSTESIPSAARNVCWIRLIKGGSVLLFMFGVVGAFIYAINSQDEKKSNDKRDFNSTYAYSVYQTQCSSNGEFVLGLMAPNSTIYTISGSSFWYQDDEKKTLTYQVDDKTVVWVFKERSFWATIDEKGQTVSCEEDPSTGYEEYIRQLSLTDMYNRHSEKRETRGDTEVFVFDGDPVEWEYKRVEPYLVQAFAASDDGRLMEFHSYYTGTTNNGWISLGYSFHDMAFASLQFMEQHGKSNKKIKLVEKMCKIERRTEWSLEPRIQNKLAMSDS